MGFDFRFGTVDASGSIATHKLTFKFKGSDCKSITDKTAYVPDAEAVKRLKMAGAESLISPSMYDFPDGVDDGRKVPVARLKGVDIAEVQAAIREDDAVLADKIGKARRRADYEEALRADSAATQSAATQSDTSN